MIQLVELTNRFGRWLADHLWQMSVELAILAAVVLGVVWLLRVRSAAVRHAFWGLVLAKPVAMFLVASPVSLYWFLRPRAVVPPPARRAVARAAPRRVQPAVRPVRPMAVRRAVRPPARPPAPAPAWWERIDEYGMLATVWGFVVAALALRLVVGWAYVTFLRQTARLQRAGPLVEAVEAAGRALGMRRRARVAVCEASHGPVLAGVFRPVILLPRSVVEGMSPRQVRLIIAHEMGHVCRWDNLVLLVQRLAEALLFFHPVVWLVGWAMRRDAETACDDAVLRAFGASAEYADSLTRVAELRSGLTRRLLVNTFAAAESNLSRRVRRILRGRAGRSTFALTVLSVAALVVVGLVGLPTAAEPKAPPAVPAKKGSKAMLAKLTLKGNGHRQDSFSLVVQAVGRVLGRRVSYERVLALSSNGFAPAYRPRESCTAWWGMYDRDRSMDLVGRAVGLRFRRLPKPPAGLDLPQGRTHAAGHIREAMAAGEVVITDGGWKVFGPWGFNPWCWWGVITEAKADGTIRGAALNGRRDNPVEWPYTYWAVSRCEPTLTDHEADVQMLLRAVARVRGDNQPFLPGNTVFGLAAMDLWAAQLEEVPFCPGCKDESLGCLMETARPTYEDSRRVAAVLRKRAEAFGPKARLHVEAAAARYERIRELLAPAFTGKGGEHYTAIVNHRAKQREHAKVVRAAKAELAAVGDALARALAAEGVDVPAPTAGREVETAAAAPEPAPKRRPGTQWKGLQAERGWITRMGGMIGAAKHLELPATPSWIYGGSGHAFALNIHELICPSGPTAWPTEHVNRLAANVGLKCEMLTTPKNAPDAAEKLKQMWTRGTAALDAGRPCMAWWLDHGEWYVVNGYDANGNFLYDDFGHKTGRKHHAKLADNGTDFAAMLILDRTTPASDAKVFTDAVRFALDHGEGKHSREIWYTGLAAYEAWIAALTSEEALKNKDIGFGHAYNAQCWAECRRHAVAFCQEAGKRLGTAKTRAGFDAAVRHYQTVSKQLNLVAKTFPFDVADRKAMDERIADPARRKKAVDALAAARAAELAGLKALAEVAVALGAEGIDPKTVGATAVAVPAATAPGQILLKGPVVAFNNLIGRLGGHGVVGGEDGREEYVQCPVFVSLHTVQMRAAGWDVDYDTVAAVSGYSALFAYDPKTLSPKYHHLMIGMDGRIAEATGFGYEWVDFIGAEDAWRIVKESVNAGKSVKAMDWEGILFAGYQDAKDPADRKVFAMADGPSTSARWLAWKQFGEWADRVTKWKDARLGRHTRRVRKASAKATALGVIRNLVEWSVTPPDHVTKRLPRAKHGLAGIAAYADDVADAKGKPPAYFKETAWTGCHAINPQWTARNSTAVFLKRTAAAKVLNARANAHVLAAAEAYHAAYLAWGRFYEQLGHHAPKNAWADANRRAAGGAAAREWLRREHAALAELRAALVACGAATAEQMERRAVPEKSLPGFRPASPKSGARSAAPLTPGTIQPPLQADRCIVFRCSKGTGKLRWKIRGQMLEAKSLRIWPGGAAFQTARLLDDANGFAIEADTLTVDAAAMIELTGPPAGEMELEVNGKTSRVSLPDLRVRAHEIRIDTKGHVLHVTGVKGDVEMAIEELVVPFLENLPRVAPPDDGNSPPGFRALPPARDKK